VTSWLDPFFTAYSTIQAQGVPLPQQEILNFGAGFVITNDVANKRTTVNFPGGGGGGSVTGTGLWFSTSGSLGSAAITLDGDVTQGSLSGTNLPLEVTGILSNSLPSLTRGVVAWSGAAWIFAGAPGTPAYNPAWYAFTDIYIDPVSGNDAAAGNTSGTAIKTWGEAFLRWGGTRVMYTHSVTVHQLSSQPASTDQIFLDVQLVNATFFAIIGTLTAVGGTFSAGTVSAKVRSTTDQRLRVASMPGGASAGMLVHNVTNDSWATIDAMSGSTAIMNQPYLSSNFSTIGQDWGDTEDDGWATGNTLQLYTLPNLNLQHIGSFGADSITSENLPCVWLQNLNFPDPSGSPGNTGIGLESHDACTIEAIFCTSSAFIYTTSLAVNGNGFLGCWMLGGCQSQGEVNNNFHIGGSIYCPLNNSEGRFAYFAGDIYIHAAASNFLLKEVYSLFTQVYIDGELNVAHGTEVRLYHPAPSIYGPGYILLAGPYAAAILQSSTTWVNSVILGAQSYINDGVDTGSQFDPTALGNPYTPGILVTPANLDAAPGTVLIDPVTANRFCPV
jgi:hypothetical protein